MILLNIFVQGHNVVTLEALGPGSVLQRKGKRESPGEEECLQPRLEHSNRILLSVLSVL